MSTGCSQAVFLVHVHLGVLLFTASVSKVSHFIELLLKLVVARAFKRKAKVGWIRLVACVSPLAFGSVACHELFLLLFRPQHLELFYH